MCPLAASSDNGRQFTSCFFGSVKLTFMLCPLDLKFPAQRPAAQVQNSAHRVTVTNHPTMGPVQRQVPEFAARCGGWLGLHCLWPDKCFFTMSRKEAAHAFDPLVPRPFSTLRPVLPFQRGCAPQRLLVSCLLPLLRIAAPNLGPLFHELHLSDTAWNH